MKNIINMVLDVRKMELGHDTLQLELHPLNSWLQEIAEDFRNEFHNKGIRLEYQWDPNIAEISFDSSKCEVILSNLLTNALKFSPPDTLVTLKTSQTDGFIRIAVTDQGIGLQHIQPEQLFTRFGQGLHNRGGSGIGLSYAKILTEMHGGHIEARNNPEGSGCTFWIELPANLPAEKRACAPGAYLNELLDSPITQAPELQNFSTQNYSLLIVEDETDLQQFLKNALKSNFKHVYIASNGQEALDMIRQTPPDIVVSDIMMPKMDGYELCQHIKENLNISHIPVVLLTARSDAESTQAGYKTGADSYIAKPFELDFLQTILLNQLKNRELIKQKYRQESHWITPQESTFSNADEKFLLQLNTLISEELGNPDLTVNFITEKLAFSRASLYNKVKALTGLGVNDYIIRFKLEKACHWLQTTELSILEISENTGFANQRYFSTVFKQTYGCTPSEYRKAHTHRPPVSQENTGN